MSSVTYTVPRAWLDDAARVYPVEIDPNLFTQSPTDIYIASGYPSTCYGTATELLCGKVSTATGTCKTLVKFPQINTSIPTTAHVAAATFSLRQFWQPSGAHDRTHAYRVGVGSTLWGEGGSWNGITIDENSPEISAGSFSPSGNVWFNIVCLGTVQYWVKKTANYNKGFLISQLDTIKWG